MVEIRQGFHNLSAATKKLEKLVRGGELIHGGNPVLRWNASKVSVRTDASGRIKPDKERNTEKIDGTSALVNAITRALRAENGPSVYASRGVRTIEW
jgi:phage terminase large subunit-like protein